MPGSLTHTFQSLTGGPPRTVAMPAVGNFLNPQILEAETVWLIVGQTLDSAGAVLAGCTVTLFRTSDDMPQKTTLSDASGNYSFSVERSTTYYSVAYKAGSPDVTGATVDTLAGVP
jgi:hypothetical protein